MTISVAIATYNRAPMVREAVLAALVQSRAPHEIVVSDDASADQTVATIQNVGDPRVKLVRQVRNSGGVGNWNAAIDATCGDLIAWCSDDDRFLPGHLEDRPPTWKLIRKLVWCIPALSIPLSLTMVSNNTFALCGRNRSWRGAV